MKIIRSLLRFPLRAFFYYLPLLLFFIAYEFFLVIIDLRFKNKNYEFLIARERFICHSRMIYIFGFNKVKTFLARIGIILSSVDNKP